jgi:hypothetical protein
MIQIEQFKFAYVSKKTPDGGGLISYYMPNHNLGRLFDWDISCKDGYLCRIAPLYDGLTYKQLPDITIVKGPIDCANNVIDNLPEAIKNFCDFVNKYSNK